MSARDLGAIARYVVIALLSVGSAAAQSTSATLSGVAFDEHGAVLAETAVTLTNLDTGAKRRGTSDQAGRFRVAGVIPGRYELRLERPGFTSYVHSPIDLSIGQDLNIEPVLSLAKLTEQITVKTARIAGIEATKTSLGRTFTAGDIDGLPVPGRDFTTLATLVPGVLPDLNQGGGSAPNLTGFAAAAQMGRNNAVTVDGLSHDDALPGAMRGGVSLEAVREFVVSSNGFAAEYGQASGAVVNVVTRSGTNVYSARAFYYHRDDAWDATPGSAKLAVPPVDKARLEQKIVGGVAGGPLSRDRAFFFGSIEHLDRDTDHVVTSSQLRVFRPDDPATLPQRTRNPNLLGRVDINITPGSLLTARYRFDDSSATHRFTEADVRLATAERAHDLIRRDQDLAIVNPLQLGTRGLNEVRVLFARRFVDLNVDPYCPDCPAEDRPSIKLGKSFNLPQKRTEDRLQLADTITWLSPGGSGDHTLKAGFDLSFVRDDNFFPLNFAGTFTFRTDALFDANDAATYPNLFTGSAGPPQVNLQTSMYAAFLQDQWRPTARLTVNAGARWDYERGPGISHDSNNVAPRLGLSYDVSGTAKTVVRASFGHYYDQVFLLVAREVEQAATLVQTRIEQPGYPDPTGPNPNRTAPRPLVPSVTRYGSDMQTPYTVQASLGIEQELGPSTVLSVDGVWARGYHLLAAHDLNYPNLDDPQRRRPDPNFQVMTAYETRGNSWYKAVQASVRRQHAAGFAYFVAYTLSDSERDTEDFRFVPQDQRDYAADRGPGANDSRHRFAGNVTAELPLALRASGVLTARSALPYNITTGVDNNRDGVSTTDRPAGVGRNAGRGAAFLQTDIRLSRSFRLQRVRLEVLGEIFNVTNRRNWIGHIGNQSSLDVGKPTAASGAREIQLGIRVEYAKSEAADGQGLMLAAIAVACLEPLAFAILTDGRDAGSGPSLPTAGGALILQPSM